MRRRRLRFKYVALGNNSVVILNAFTNLTGLKVNYFLYMGYSIPYAIMTILMFLILCKFLFKIDIENLKNFNPDKLSADSQNINTEKKLALYAMIALILLILIPSCFPDGSAIVSISDRFGLSGKLLLIFAATQIIRINGAPGCNFVQTAKKGISWSLMMVVANILAFSTLIGNDKQGSAAF